mmetsp:Transcript_99561/g.290666  ORF Transcript_99561/g.290666 Transcript_99561/m.290666 type:complete len:321 (+) Transcript_99561:71-1033(+)
MSNRSEKVAGHCQACLDTNHQRDARRMATSPKKPSTACTQEASGSALAPAAPPGPARAPAPGSTIQVRRIDNARAGAPGSRAEQLVQEARRRLLAQHPRALRALDGLDPVDDPGRRGRELLGLALVEHGQGCGAHEVAEVGGLHEVRHGDVEEAGVRLVLGAVGRQALGDAHARAVELAHDPPLLRRGRARRGREDEVGRPPQRDGLAGQVQRGHDLGQVPLQEVGRELGKLRLLWPVEGVDRAGPTHGRNASLLGLLVDDADKRIAHHVVAQLSLHNAGTEALVHKLATGSLPAFEVLAHSLGCPIPRLCIAPIDAELN